jgi:HSP20 family molecular chaperone IbpA
MKMLDYGLFQLYKNLGVYGAAYDVQDNDDEIIFTMGVPGMKEEDIDVRVRDNKRLVIKSLKTSKYTPEFNYVFTLPVGIIKKETYAMVHDGLLEVHLKKEEKNEFKVSLR